MIRIIDRLLDSVIRGISRDVFTNRGIVGKVVDIFEIGYY